jgi:hypothetical protein
MYNDTCTKCKTDETRDFCDPENTGYKKNVIPPVIRQSTVDISSKGMAIKPQLFPSYSQLSHNSSHLIPNSI